MSRYFLHIDQPASVRDDDGEEFANHQLARCGALQRISEAMRANPDEFWGDHSHTVRVTDAADLTLFILDVSTTRAAAAGGPTPCVR